jgi:hypothetical protein
MWIVSWMTVNLHHGEATLARTLEKWNKSLCAPRYTIGCAFDVISCWNGVNVAHRYDLACGRISAAAAE